MRKYFSLYMFVDSQTGQTYQISDRRSLVRVHSSFEREELEHILAHPQSFMLDPGAEFVILETIKPYG